VADDRLAGARLQTDGGLNYTLLEGYPTFDFDEDKASAKEAYLMKATDMAAFVQEAQPLPYVKDGVIFIPGRRRMPGTNFMITKKISVKPHTGMLPSDPLAQDTDAPADTYDPEMVVTIDYETAKDGGDDGGNDRDPTDPITFLERSIEVGGEFLTLGPQNTETSKEDLGEQQQQQQQQPNTDLKATADPNLAIVKLIPTAELSYKWSFVIRPPWGTIFDYLGSVNSANGGAVFYNMEPETVVYQGISASQKFLWNGSNISAQPWEVTYKFSVKRVAEGGKVFGWNHIWVPKSQSWEKLWRRVAGGGRLALYKGNNLSNLFVSGTAADARVSG
jgi:hypothetical protein